MEKLVGNLPSTTLLRTHASLVHLIVTPLNWVLSPARAMRDTYRSGSASLLDVGPVRPVSLLLLEQLTARYVPPDPIQQWKAAHPVLYAGPGMYPQQMDPLPALPAVRGTFHRR